MARENGIACDFCETPLTDRPLFTKDGWSYTWAEMEFGSASFAYASCKACCQMDHSFMDRSVACVRRAERHGKAWRRAVDRFIVLYIEAGIGNRTIVMRPNVIGTVGPEVCA